MHSAFNELVQNWCNAEDLESFEHVAKEAVDFIVGPVSFQISGIVLGLIMLQNCHPDLQDDVCIILSFRKVDLELMCPVVAHCFLGNHLPSFPGPADRRDLEYNHECSHESILSCLPELIFFQRAPLKPEAYASIKQPVLLINVGSPLNQYCSIADVCSRVSVMKVVRKNMQKGWLRNC
jgi:hypothetical protein